MQLLSTISRKEKQTKNIFRLLFLVLNLFITTIPLRAQWIQTNGPYSSGDVCTFTFLGTNLFAGITGGIFLSTDNGTVWTAVNTGLTNTSVQALAVSTTNLIAGTLGGVFLSTDSGTIWTSVNTGLTNASVLALAVTGTNLFAGTLGGVFLSTNNGKNWNAVDSGLTNNNVRILTVSATNLFVGTESGIFLLTSNRTSWTDVNTGLGNTNIRALAVSGMNLFAGTVGGGGVWRRPLTEMITGVEDNQKQIPDRFALDQNYPNPFNPSTVISYQLLVVSNVKLTIYDMLGREIVVLVDGKQNTGTHQTQWNAEGLPSGVYFYRLQAGTFTETKKLVLLR